MAKIDIEEKLKQAASVFYGLESQSLVTGPIRVPRVAQKHFQTVAFATAKLYALGKEELLRLEKERVVHPSTISGNSLQSALGSLEGYLCGRKELDKDDYEQLSRTCMSVLNLMTGKKY